MIEAQHALLCGRADEALRRAEECVAISERQNWRFNDAMARLVLAEVRVQRGEFREAAAELDRVDAVLALGGAHVLDITVDLLHADVLLARGDAASGLASLAKALASGRERGDRRAALMPVRVARLCALALRSGIEPDYVRVLIRAAEIPPPDDADETWPWPVRITTFGGLRIERHGEPLAFVRKTPKRLVALLKALVTYGGIDVPEEKLVDAVWPDEDGDAGHRALTVAMHRLRKLLGDAQVLNVKGGRVGLDPSRCWLDVWVFERHLARRVPGETDEGCRKRVEHGLALYAGEFLADDDAWWLIEVRDRMHEAYMRGRRAISDLNA